MVCMRAVLREMQFSIRTQDEQLSVVLFARIKTPETERHTDPDEPPPTLIQFLLHLQVGLEALYVPSGSPHPGRTSLVNAPPRTVSFGRVKPKLTAPHTPIVSDRTSPLTDDTPRQSAVAPPEGTLLSATIWGQNRAEDPLEQFSLAWSPSEKLWVAMYKFTLPVCKRFISLFSFPSSLTLLKHFFA
jgi:hypothetical protein